MPDRFEAPGPYPEVRVEKPNADYARLILSDMSAQISETTAVAAYMYSRFITYRDEDLTYIFRQIANIESRHFDILGRLAFLLGGDPRLWEQADDGSMRYWSPTYLEYPTTRDALLNYLLANEFKGVEQYHQHIELIDDPYVKENIARIIEDEDMHIIELENLIEQKNI